MYDSNKSYKTLAGDESSRHIGLECAKAVGAIMMQGQHLSSHKRFYSWGCWAMALCTLGFMTRPIQETTWIFCSMRTEYGKIVIFTDKVAIYKAKAPMKFLDDVEYEVSCSICFMPTSSVNWNTMVLSSKVYRSQVSITITHDNFNGSEDQLTSYR